jgi:serine/threonine protein kinase
MLGRYELVSLLARGGMGEVYLAKSRRPGGFERLVVVKCSLSSLPAERDQMLLAEARLAATMQHGNIVQVYDVDTDGGVVFLAMEYLHGQDVRNVFKRTWGRGQPLPLEHAAAIALAVCGGLHYAHEMRDADGSPLEIVHRDISPSNVFVTYDGVVKLIDFGIAKATTLPSDTQLGTIKGKPGYMSPEQCRCEPLDRRSDLFCVGIMLYELTTGRRPFNGDSEYLLYKAIAEQAPTPPSQLDPAYPPQLETIVMRLLAKDRRSRFPTSHEVGEALREFANAQRLDISHFALARYMASLFRDDLDAWHHAQRAGQSLIEHVIRRTTETLAALPGGVETNVIAASGDSLRTTQPHARRRRRGWLAASVAAALFAGALGIVFSMRSSSDSARTQPSPPESPRATGEEPRPPSPAPEPAPAPPPVDIAAKPAATHEPAAAKKKPSRATSSRKRTPAPTEAPAPPPPAPPPRGPDDPI